MLKKQLFDTFRSTRAKIVFFVFLAIMVYNFADTFYWTHQAYDFHPENYPGGLENMYHPSIAGFLNSPGSSNNPQILIKWLLPIWGLLFGADSFIREKRCGYLPLMDTRISRKRYFWKKNQGAFISGFLLMVVPLAVNYLLSSIGFFGGEDFMNLDAYVGMPGQTQWFNFSMAHPVGIYLFYIVINGVITGLLCCMGTSLSMALPSYPLVYAICFMVWYPQISNGSSILLAMQPFLNYPVTTFLTGYVIFLIPVILAMIAGYIRRVKCDTL